MELGRRVKKEIWIGLWNTKQECKMDYSFPSYFLFCFGRNEKGKGRAKMTWRGVVLKNMQFLDNDAELVSNRAEWWKSIHVTDPNYFVIKA